MGMEKCSLTRFHFDKNEIPCFKKLSVLLARFSFSTGVSSMALERTVQKQNLEPNNWRDAAVRESGCPSSNNKINFEEKKADGCRRRVQIPACQ
jgi:hypothetical protein